MVCQIFYSSEYINGCNIAKFGEGCEKCVPLFKSVWMLDVAMIGIYCLAIFVLSLIVAHIHNKQSSKDKKE